MRCTFQSVVIVLQSFFLKRNTIFPDYYNVRNGTQNTERNIDTTSSSLYGITGTKWVTGLVEWNIWSTQIFAQIEYNCLWRVWIGVVSNLIGNAHAWNRLGAKIFRYFIACSGSMYCTFSVHRYIRKCPAYSMGFRWFCYIYWLQIYRKLKSIWRNWVFHFNLYVNIICVCIADYLAEIILITYNRLYIIWY